MRERPASALSAVSIPNMEAAVDSRTARLWAFVAIAAVSCASLVGEGRAADGDGRPVWATGWTSDSRATAQPDLPSRVVYRRGTAGGLGLVGGPSYRLIPASVAGSGLYADSVATRAEQRASVSLSRSLPAEEAGEAMPTWNLGLRALLELSALGAMGWWGHQQTDGAGRYALMVGVPALGAAAWGTFAVKGDPSRSGAAPVPVGGVTRLALELGVFAFATWALTDIDRESIALGLASATVIHYAFSYRRVSWLLSR